MSSRLFTEVREKRGLAYYVRAGANPFQDVGYTAVEGGLTKGRLDEAISVIIGELKKIKDHDVREDELRLAKDYVKGKTVLALEESSQIADFFGRQELLSRRVETAEQKLARLEAVTAADVRRTARELFRPARLSMALIGPFKDVKPFARLVQKL
jgi:predicted Zn-dependent peptidase